MDPIAQIMNTPSVRGAADLSVEAAMTSASGDLRALVAARHGQWVVVTTMSAALCLGALAGCTNAPAQEGADPTSSSSPQNAQAERFALESTVDYLHLWSHQHLYEEVRGITDRSSAIPRETRGRAVQKAIAGAVAVHIGCDSVHARLIEPVTTTIEVRANGCTYPVSATETGKLAEAQACVMLAAPAETVDAFLDQAAQDPVGSPPILVDSSAKAGPGTWYVGPCRRVRR